MADRKRYAQVGLGGRGEMYSLALTDSHADQGQLVGICDSNPGRIQRTLDMIGSHSAHVFAYSADQFDQMLQETHAEGVIVTSMDATHHDYIVRALQADCDVITEKPMTIGADQCQQIVNAQKSSGRTVRVTFNYRYSPHRTQIKELLMSGVIGEIRSVDFHWMLDTGHGTDYFRRWHRNKKNSGGLLVHKATHHFDLVNWWLSDIPSEVYATGRRCFYTPETARRMGLSECGERCHGCREADRCPFFLDMAANENLKSLYLDCEKFDGYFRDRCVFSPEIDIEDTMAVQVKYSNDVLLSYSLNAGTPWEGYTITFNGSHGRLEHKCEESVYINADGSVPGALKPEGTWTRVYPFRAQAYEVPVWESSGGHGGGDELLLDDVFAASPCSDRYMRAADHRAGAYSILVGVAANRSIETGQSVRVDSLVSGLARPDFPEMPDHNQPIPIVETPSE